MNSLIRSTLALVLAITPLTGAIAQVTDATAPAVAGRPPPRELPKGGVAVTDAETPTPNPGKEVFEFAGGNLGSFLEAIRVHFGVNLEEIGTVPRHLRYSVDVPKMRITTSEYRQVLNLYNEISKDGDGSMGRWIVKSKSFQGDTREPFAVMLIGPDQPEEPIMVKVYSLRLSESQLKNLEEVIHQETHELWQIQVSSPRRRTPDQIRDGRISYHPSTSILVVKGSAAYVDLASAIIDAYRDPSDLSAQQSRRRVAPAPEREPEEPKK